MVDPNLPPLARRLPVVQVTVFDDGTFLVTAKPDHRGEAVQAVQIILDAIEAGNEHLIRNMY